MSDRDDARDAGMLLRFALDHSLVPARHDTYGRLLDRYHTDPELRTAFDQVITGLGLRVAAVDRSTGIVLLAEAGSPLAVADTKRWLPIDSAADRMVYGLALAGAAAWCYPNAKAVREPGTRRVTAVDVDRLIRDHAAAVENGGEPSSDGFGEAWNAYRFTYKQVDETPTGRLKRRTTVRMCEDALAMLHEFGLLLVDRTTPPPRPDLRAWRSTDRFRACVAVGGGPLVWQTLAGVHAEEPVGASGTGGEDG
ncbi:hypothetical protein O4J56_16935 [Nocardiopsis sp. RSe5-2]|uniref:DUF2398 family protein n=1 Tax=Nocardiopsis endophytica TaxID=3018445 RepID=A0ABT4U789_9ACTN|nr:hypothetical protein [Nocardiopsis endophytica]MDA2812329.1 hypothetical protein [Nocardiopsis endophytica]